MTHLTSYLQSYLFIVIWHFSLSIAKHRLSVTQPISAIKKKTKKKTHDVCASSGFYLDELRRGEDGLVGHGGGGHYDRRVVLLLQSLIEHLHVKKTQKTKSVEEDTQLNTTRKQVEEAGKTSKATFTQQVLTLDSDFFLCVWGRSIC